MALRLDPYTTGRPDPAARTVTNVAADTTTAVTLRSTEPTPATRQRTPPRPATGRTRSPQRTGLALIQGEGCPRVADGVIHGPAALLDVVEEIAEARREQVAEATTWNGSGSAVEEMTFDVGSIGSR